jgi:hypothetical protein
MTRLISVYLAMAAISLSTTARADVLSPAPEECPRGSEGEECHGPPRCAPLTCTTDSDCGDGLRCQSLDLCINRVNCSGRAMIDVDAVLSVCGEGTACTEGSCQTMQVCATGGVIEEDASADADALDTDGGVQVRTWGCGGCRLAGTERAGGALLLALIPALILLRRRLRRR